MGRSAAVSIKYLIMLSNALKGRFFFSLCSSLHWSTRWSLMLMAINTFVFCSYTQNYRISMDFCFVLPASTEYLLILLRAVEIPDSGYCWYIHFNVIFPHYFCIFPKWMTLWMVTCLFFHCCWCCCCCKWRDCCLSLASVKWFFLLS